MPCGAVRKSQLLVRAWRKSPAAVPEDRGHSGVKNPVMSHAEEWGPFSGGYRTQTNNINNMSRSLFSNLRTGGVTAEGGEPSGAIEAATARHGKS